MSIWLVIGRGVHAQLILGAFDTPEKADAARQRLQACNDNWHDLELLELQVNAWGPDLPCIRPWVRYEHYKKRLDEGWEPIGDRWASLNFNVYAPLPTADELPK